MDDNLRVMMEASDRALALCFEKIPERMTEMNFDPQTHLLFKILETLEGIHQELIEQNPLYKPSH